MPKFNLHLTAGAYGVLSELARDLDMSMADVLRESLGLYAWSSRQIAAGRDLAVVEHGITTTLAIPTLNRVAPQPGNRVVVPRSVEDQVDASPPR